MRGDERIGEGCARTGIFDQRWVHCESWGEVSGTVLLNVGERMERERANSCCAPPLLPRREVRGGLVNRGGGLLLEERVVICMSVAGANFDWLTNERVKDNSCARSDPQRLCMSTARPYSY